MRKTGVMPLLLLLAACGSISTVRSTSADGQGVTFEFPADHQDEATRQAMLYCANLGRGAVLKSTRPEGGDGRVAIYDCR
jgi:hypothetical protein